MMGLHREDINVRYSRRKGRVMTIDEKRFTHSRTEAREKIKKTGEEKKGGKRRKEKKEEEKSRARRERNRVHGCSVPRGGAPQTETHSPELCNSLLKQSHPGTLSSLHPAGSPASAPDPSEPPERARTL